MQNDADEFYRRRHRFNTLVVTGEANSPEAAALFYYLNRTGYNGLCRFNRGGVFNVPFGRYRRIAYASDFLLYREAFERWAFTWGDFTSVPLDDDDFVYADPPYDVPFTQYAQCGFGWNDQQRTVEWLSTHRGPVVLVNQATERIVRLYRSAGYFIQFLQAPRRISRSGDRTPAIEILATRNL
jgi:DNA adenine methylase